MKKIIYTLLVTVISFSIYAQDKLTYESATYINDISVSEIPRFIELHKKFTDMSLGENRKLTGDWLFRHWYGSGHTFVNYTQFDSMEDYLKDSKIANKNIEDKINSTKDEKEKETLKEERAEFRAFWDGHTDEIRGVYSSTGFLTVENVNFDLPFVMSVGKYNSSGSWSKLGNAFFNWTIKPDIDKGFSIAGGVSYHYMGSGPEVEVWQSYNDLVDFANAVTSKSPQDENSIEARKTFWSLVEGSHEDQIYLHIGHVDLEKGIFDLAGKDK